MSDLPQPPLPESLELQAEMAKQVLDNPLFWAIVAELDTEAVNTWRRGTNAEQREQAWHQMIAVAAIVHKFRGRLESKRLADSRNRRS